MTVEWSTIITAAISSGALIVVALLPRKEVKKLRSENTDQHEVNKRVAERTHQILERFETEADHDRKSILKAVTAVERKVEKVDGKVDNIGDRLSHHIDWHLQQGE